MRAASVSDSIAKAEANVVVNGYTGVYDGAAHGATGSATGLNGEDLSGLLSLGSSFMNVPGGTANWSFAGNGNYNCRADRLQSPSARRMRRSASRVIA
jgi:hypothetical protein